MIERPRCQYEFSGRSLPYSQPTDSSPTAVITRARAYYHSSYKLISSGAGLTPFAESRPCRCPNDSYVCTCSSRQLCVPADACEQGCTANSRGPKHLIRSHYIPFCFVVFLSGTGLRHGQGRLKESPGRVLLSAPQSFRRHNAMGTRAYSHAGHTLGTAQILSPAVSHAPVSDFTSVWRGGKAIYERSKQWASPGRSGKSLPE